MTLLLRSLGMVLVLTSAVLAQDQDAESKKDAATPKKESAEAAQNETTQDNAAKADADKADAAKPDADAAKPASDPAAAFAGVMTEWRGALLTLRDLQKQAQAAPEGSLAELQKQWEAAVQQAADLLPKLRQAGVAAYKAAPNVDRPLARFLVDLLEDDMRRDAYEEAWELSKLLIDGKSSVREIYEHAGMAAFGLHDFDAAEAMLNAAKERDALTPEGDSTLAILPEYRELWTKEQEIRKKEAEADDLPRVKLTTNRGEVILELFENEAPETVGNFISLVEDKFYDGLTFHRVLAGFMAQGGCPDGDGRGGPGYQIYCETSRDDARMHFRGTLSMAHAGENTGGSQFFLTFRPTSHLNKKHTVFGRVIEGFDVLSKLQRRDPNSLKAPTADQIVKAEVIRKRDHAYGPNKRQ